MAEAYIVDALRTPTGKRGGTLSQVHPVDLGAHVIGSLVARNAIPADEYDDVIFGCLDQIGPQSGCIARTCWLAAGLANSVPGVTIDRQCGSSQQAVHFAAQAVMSGTAHVMLAGGVQSMSLIPIGASGTAARQYGFDNVFHGSKTWYARYQDQEISQFRGAQLIAERWQFSREQLEEFALHSNNRALMAIEEGRLKREIVPLNGLEMDETARRTSMEKMAALQPVVPGTVITAAVASQISDGASALLIVSETALKRYNLKPRARVHHMTVLGDDPVMMLAAPIPATRLALKRSGMRVADIDLAEVNEAFAPVPMAWMKELDFPHEKLNVNGGAIALGHPLGASGTKLMATLLHELERTNKRWGLQTMCEGGGQANVTIIERL
ncbi:MAG: acetyl-CoA C-acetyltransferase [Steroidobacteraceae bacterium]